MSNEPNSPKKTKVYERSLLISFLSETQIAEAQQRAEAEPVDGLVVSSFLSGVVKKFVKANPDHGYDYVEPVAPISDFQRLLDTPLHVLAAQKDHYGGLDDLEYTG